MPGQSTYSCQQHAKFNRLELKVSANGRVNLRRHPHAGGDPSKPPKSPNLRMFPEVPTCAEMTMWVACMPHKSQRRSFPDSRARRQGPKHFATPGTVSVNLKGHRATGISTAD